MKLINLSRVNICNSNNSNNNINVYYRRNQRFKNKILKKNTPCFNNLIRKKKLKSQNKGTLEED